jgi:hypothetical protein
MHLRCSLKRRLYSSLLYTSRADVFLPMSSSWLIRRSNTARSFITASMFGYMANPSYLSSRMTIAKARSTDCKWKNIQRWLLQSEVKNTRTHFHTSPKLVITTSNANSRALHNVRHSPKHTAIIYLSVHCVKCFSGQYMFTRYYASLSPTIHGKRRKQLGVDFNTENEHCSDKAGQGRFESKPKILSNPD